MCRRMGTIVALAGDNVQGKPSPSPKLQVLSVVEVERHTSYEGPTWLDQAIISKWRQDAQVAGFATDLRQAFATRGQWLVERKFAEVSPAGVIAPKPDMMRNLRRAETERLVRDLSWHLNATYIH